MKKAKKKGSGVFKFRSPKNKRGFYGVIYGYLKILVKKKGADFLSSAPKRDI